MPVVCNSAAVRNAELAESVRRAAVQRTVAENKGALADDHDDDDDVVLFGECDEGLAACDAALGSGTGSTRQPGAGSRRHSRPAAVRGRKRGGSQAERARPARGGAKSPHPASTSPPPRRRGSSLGRATRKPAGSPPPATQVGSGADGSKPRPLRRTPSRAAQVVAQRRTMKKATSSASLYRRGQGRGGPTTMATMRANVAELTKQVSSSQEAEEDLKVRGVSATCGREVLAVGVGASSEFICVTCVVRMAGESSGSAGAVGRVPAAEQGERGCGRGGALCHAG